MFQQLIMIIPFKKMKASLFIIDIHSLWFRLHLFTNLNLPLQIQIIIILTILHPSVNHVYLYCPWGLRWD